MPTPVLIKPVSSRCNLTCDYCFYREPHQPAQGELMEHALFMKLVADPYWGSERRLDMIFQGGEPTLAGLEWFRKAQDIISPSSFGEEARGDRVLVTNGTLIDEEWAGFLHTHNWVVSVSIDGPANDLRGLGEKGRKRVERGIGHLRSAGVEPMLICTVTAGNMFRPTETLQYLATLGEHVYFIPAKAPRQCAVGYGPTGTEFRAFLEAVASEARPGRTEVSVRNFQEGRAAWLGHPISCVQDARCGYPTVEANGRVSPCDFFTEPEFCLGNLWKETMHQMMTSPKALAFRARKTKPADECETCPVFAGCRRGCPRDRYLTGDANSLSPMCASHKYVAEITKP